MRENKVRFCKKCVESNQRYMTSAQHNLKILKKYEIKYFN